MLWSSVSIPGKPGILMVDASQDRNEWESAFCARLFTSMRRRGLVLLGDAPARIEDPEELAEHLEPDGALNCILLLGHGEGAPTAAAVTVRSCWEWLSRRSDLAPKLFAACTWESYDPDGSREILESPTTFAPLALAQQSPLTPREASLYYLKFFTELELHSEAAITGRMVWFSGSKAKELLRRRRLPGTVGVRC